MRKVRILLIVILGLGILIGLTLFLIGYLKPKSAGIFIETTPASVVFVNGSEIGKTPYDGTFPPGEVTLKLVPEATSSLLSSFETKVALTSGIKTVVRRTFGETDDTSEGEIVSFEKVQGGESSLVVVSFPDAAKVIVDGATRGFTPVKVSSLTPGEHQIVVSAPGFSERTLNVKTLLGYKLTAIVKLAVLATTPVEPAPEEKQTLIEILTTPTGFLRVRSEANTSSSEVAQVKPGEKYLFMEENDDASWIKIEYEKGKYGWISGQYGKKVEEVLPTPTPAPTP
jgi:hypothetical protein